MKGELILTDYGFEHLFEIYDDFDFDSVPNKDFALSIYVNKDKTIDKQLKNKQGFIKSIKNYRECREDFGPLDEKEEKELKYIEDNFDNIMDSIEYIQMNFNDINPIDYIKKNPIVLTKKIVLDIQLDITDYDRLIILMKEYKDVIDNIYLRLTDNEEYVSLNDCYKTMNLIKSQTEFIKSLNLSPMETIMFTYDLVRNRVYNHENEDEAYSKSRDLKDVLSGDKIVCAGYANLFHTYLEYLGIDSRIVRLERLDEKTGHARNVIYVKDDKYKIDGVYYFDPTWDSKTKEDDNSYLLTYRCFAKTRSEMDAMNNYDYEDIWFPKYSHSMFKTVKNIIDKGDYSKLKYFQNSINYMASITGEEHLVNPITIMPISPLYGQFDTEDFLTKFKRIFDKFNKPLKAETMIRLLNNVRRLEFYIDSNWYPYSYGAIGRTLINSNWEFRNKHLTKEMKLYQVLYGKEFIESAIEKMDKSKIYKAFVEEEKIVDDIEHVRISKLLRLVCNKKIKEEIK